MPPAFNLSQDQTLQFNLKTQNGFTHSKPGSTPSSKLQFRMSTQYSKTPVTQGPNQIKHQHLSAVQVFKERVAKQREPRIIQTAKYRSTLSPKFFEQACRIDDSPAYASMTRANLRLPTCSTTCSPRCTIAALSVTRSPFARTPPWSIMRSASDVLEVRPACFSTCAMGIPWSVQGMVNSGISSGTPPCLKRDSKSASADSAAFCE